MTTEIKTDRLLVISDLHLGNPFSQAKQPTLDFLHWIAREGYDLCINGDGFEIAQVSFAKLAKDVPDILHALKAITKNGRNVYYVVGNHDIVFENFLNDWGGFKVAPFLNVWSQDKRIRIEHGHLYDPFFVSSPDLYEFLTSLAGVFLAIHPNLYKLWIDFEKLKSKLFHPKQTAGIPGEHPNFLESVKELSERGFDGVVFGHTHHAGRVELADGKIYFNTGSWLMGTPYLDIHCGEMTLRNWDNVRKGIEVSPQTMDRQASNAQIAGPNTNTAPTLPHSKIGA